jgi:hypothetical protein
METFVLGLPANRRAPDDAACGVGTPAFSDAARAVAAGEALTVMAIGLVTSLDITTSAGSGVGIGTEPFVLGLAATRKKAYGIGRGEGATVFDVATRIVEDGFATTLDMTRRTGCRVGLGAARLFLGLAAIRGTACEFRRGDGLTTFVVAAKTVVATEVSTGTAVGFATSLDSARLRGSGSILGFEPLLLGFTATRRIAKLVGRGEGACVLAVTVAAVSAGGP